MKQYQYREVIKKIRKAGFILRRKTGSSHEIWWNEKTRKTCVIPHHREIRKGTLKSILKQAKLTEAQFEKM